MDTWILPVATAKKCASDQGCKFYRLIIFKKMKRKENGQPQFWWMSNRFCSDPFCPNNPSKEYGKDRGCRNWLAGPLIEVRIGSPVVEIFFNR